MYWAGAYTQAGACYVSPAYGHTKCHCNGNGCADGWDEEEDEEQIVYASATDAKSVFRLLNKHPATLLLNTDRGALQLLNCTGGVQYHLPLQVPVLEEVKALQREADLHRRIALIGMTVGPVFGLALVMLRSVVI